MVRQYVVSTMQQGMGQEGGALPATDAARLLSCGTAWSSAPWPPGTQAAHFPLPPQVSTLRKLKSVDFYRKIPT